jgi:hypothetical protein
MSSRKITRKFKNPQGLNKILSDIIGRSVHGDWDKDVPSEVYIGKLKKEQLEGRTSQEWGDLLEEYAFLYLKEKLRNSGWVLRRREKIGEKEFDCVGWKGEPEGKQSPDLAIEIYFSYPQPQDSYYLKHIKGKTNDMVQRLETISAKHKYVLIGIPHDKMLTSTEQPRRDIKVVYQEYRFRKVKLEIKEGVKP